MDDAEKYKYDAVTPRQSDSSQRDIKWIVYSVMFISGSYKARLERANSIAEYRNTLEDIILELVQGYVDKQFTTNDVIYILHHLPDRFVKSGQYYNFGLEWLTESVEKGNTRIAFDGGDTLAQMAAEKLRGDTKK